MGYLRPGRPVTHVKLSSRRSPLRILHVAPYSADAWAYGGIARLAGTLTRGLARRGHHVTFCATDVCDASSRLRHERAPAMRFRPWLPSSDRRWRRPAGISERVESPGLQLPGLPAARSQRFSEAPRRLLRRGTPARLPQPSGSHCRASPAERRRAVCPRPQRHCPADRAPLLSQARLRPGRRTSNAPPGRAGSGGVAGGTTGTARTRRRSRRDSTRPEPDRSRRLRAPGFARLLPPALRAPCRAPGAVSRKADAPQARRRAAPRVRAAGATRRVARCRRQRHGRRIPAPDARAVARRRTPDDVHGSAAKAATGSRRWPTPRC